MTGHTEEVVLVDENDRALGKMDKLLAHQRGVLHRAFSVFVFNEAGEMLMQRRAAGKYHSAGLWSNTCCSHPRPQEELEASAHRRLKEEMGFDCPLEHAFSFVYKTELENGLIEHELDHVLIGEWSGTPRPNPAEADEFAFLPADSVARSVRTHPEQYTAWFRMCVVRVIAIYESRRPPEGGL